MGRVVALGDREAIWGFALAGATVIEARGLDEVRRAWRELPEDVAVVLLSAEDDLAVADVGDEHPTVLRVVVPEPVAEDRS